MNSRANIVFVVWPLFLPGDVYRFEMSCLQAGRCIHEHTWSVHKSSCWSLRRVGISLCAGASWADADILLPMHGRQQRIWHRFGRHDGYLSIQRARHGTEGKGMRRSSIYTTNLEADRLQIAYCIYPAMDASWNSAHRTGERNFSAVWCSGNQKLANIGPVTVVVLVMSWQDDEARNELEFHDTG
jgi:hypothetical protein